VELLHRETREFAAPDMWPPNRLDLHKVDYRIWGVMQKQVYHTPPQVVADPWQRKMSVVDEAID